MSGTPTAGRARPTNGAAHRCRLPARRRISKRSGPSTPAARTSIPSPWAKPTMAFDELGITARPGARGAGRRPISTIEIGQGGEEAQGRGPGAETRDDHPDAGLVERRHGGQRAVGLLQQHALGDRQAEEPGFDPGVVEDVDDVPRERVVADLAGPHRHQHGGRPVGRHAGPRPALAACAPQHLHPERPRHRPGSAPPARRAPGQALVPVVEVGDGRHAVDPAVDPGDGLVQDHDRVLADAARHWCRTSSRRAPGRRRRDVAAGGRGRARRVRRAAGPPHQPADLAARPGSRGDRQLHRRRAVGPRSSTAPPSGWCAAGPGGSPRSRARRGSPAPRRR